MPTPLHISISEKLRHQIEAGDYAPGEKLPSEHDLMEVFGVSRITVRQAIANLINQGLAQSQQGKGVFVISQKKVAYDLSTPLVLLADDLAQKGIELTFKNLTFRKARLPGVAQLALNTAERSAYLQKKLLYMDGVVGAVDVSYIPLELGRQFGGQLKQQMTFPVLEENAIAIGQIDATIECIRADYETSGYLDVPLAHPLIVYRYTARATDRQPVLYGETISRADRFCYSLKMTR